MLRIYYISTNLQSHLSGNKLLYSKLTVKANHKMFNQGNHSDNTMGVLT